jgi:hypothetical protein
LVGGSVQIRKELLGETIYEREIGVKAFIEGRCGQAAN